MVKNKKLVWRIIAGICTLIWAIVLFSLIAFPDVDNVALTLNVVLYIFSITMTLLLLVFPMHFYFYTLMCLVWGLFNLVSGGSSNGLLMYTLGCLFAYKQGFFAKRTPVKYLLLLLPLIAFGFQYRFGITIMVASMMDFLFLLMFFLLAFLLFGESFIKQKDEKLAEQAEEILRLKEIIASTANAIEQDNEKSSDNVGKVDLSVLTAEGLLVVKEVLAGESFHSIGKKMLRTESAIKQQMSGIYKELNIHNKAELLKLGKDENLIFPK